ncbi:MAG TPA: AMP-binding protein, partial [Marmoricola sp.]|nr:AMP-binding protein [Marmoricola sp.]
MEHVESAPPLAHLPAARAAASAISACLRAPGTQLDNVEFANAVDTLAMKLADLDVNSGDVVAVLLPNRVEVVVTLFAAWYRGAALTPINPAQTDDEIDYQLKDSAASVIVGDARAADLAAGLGITYIDVESMLAVPVATNVRTAPILAQSDDHALIIYTSGTTGRPKGCVLDHANVNAMVSSVIAHCEFTAEDRSLLILPLFHMNGLLLGTLAALQAGGSVYIEPRFDPTTFWDTVAEYRPTYFSAVPTMFTLLNAESREPVDASSIRFAISGASPLAPALLRTFEDRFGFRVVEGYGLAETTVAVTINPVCGRRKVGTVGPPLPGQAISIVSPLGDPLPDGSVGEVVVFGPNVMRGYLGRPDDTAKVLRDRWLHTGDLGY